LATLKEGSYTVHAALRLSTEKKHDINSRKTTPWSNNQERFVPLRGSSCLAPLIKLIKDKHEDKEAQEQCDQK
jgi:hypothetical protein